MLNAKGHSSRWHIRRAVIDALQAAPGLAGLPVVVNPRAAASLDKGERVIVVKDQSDNLTERKGKTDRRTYVFNVGIISRVKDAHDDVDLLHVLASRAIRDWVDALKAQYKPVVVPDGFAWLQITGLDEGNVSFDVENLEVDGALVVIGLEVHYIRNASD